MKRWLIIGALLVAALAVGGVLYFSAPRSQLLLFPPRGAAPAPAPLEGAPSGASGPVVLALAGDAMLGRRVNKKFGNRSTYNPWARLRPALSDVDVLALNLECSITAHTERWPHKDYAFRLDPAHAARALDGIPLPETAQRYASMANNHALDFGREGLAETLGVVDGLGWHRSGAGATAVEAQRPAVITTAAGVRVGVLAVSDHCSCRSVRSWMAGEDRSGMWYASFNHGAPEHLLEAVAALDERVDLVVLSLHWGPNYTRKGAPRWMRAVARELVGAGADVIVGHSAHQVLPAEIIDGKHVFYGLGDLIHDYAYRPEYDNDLGLLAKLYIDADGTQHAELRPFRIEDTMVWPLSEEDPGHAAVLGRAGWPLEPSGSSP